MTYLPTAGREGQGADHSKRTFALVAGFGLLAMALLAPFAQFGVLQTLIVPADAAATTSNILGSAGLFRAAIAAFLIIATLDIVVAWGLYILLRPTNASLALLVAWLRVAYAAVFAYALVNLLDVAQLLQNTSATALSPVQVQAQVASSIASFNNGWDLALAIFGLHLVGLGALLFKAVDFPKVLGALVAVAGVGYLADSFGTILVPDYTLTISVFTFIGEALLIVWLFKLAIKGSRRFDSPHRVAGSGIRGGCIMTSLESGHFLSRVRGGLAMNVSQQSTSTRSPVLAILASLVVGIVLAIALLLGPASGASEPMITGSVMFAFGLGWGLMALLSTRYSAQPQTWMLAPALFLGIIWLGLMVFQPGPAAMDLLSWIWPPALAILAVWMFMQVRRNLHGRGRWLVVPVIATLLLIAVGGAFATVSAATGRTAESAAGQMVDVGGHRLYVECTGSGSPTVVLQAGLGASSSSWTGIAPKVAASTTVCAYDRAGHGRSEEAAGPQDGIALATDLHTLLERAGVAGPYVLVAHSSGGPYVRVFAARYPDQVAGMVLLDAQPAEAFTALPDYPGFYQMYRFATALAPSLARVGLVGLLLGLPADESSPSAARSARDAVAELPIALEQAKALTTLGDRPLIVVTAASDPDAGWLDAQDRMTGLSANSAHRVIAAATHDSLISGVDSTTSTQAIMDVIESIRTGTPVQ